MTSVLARTTGVVLPERVTADEVPEAMAALAAAFTDGLARAGDDELRLTFAEGVRATTRDADLLNRWLDEDAVDGLAWFPALRWRVVSRLAAIGAADPALIEAERRRDGTVDGELGAAHALAARPSLEAKTAAWAAALEDGVSNRRFESLLGGLWQVEQAALLAPFVDRYLAAAPGLAARGQAFAQRVGSAFPAIALDAGQLAAVEAAAAGVENVILRRDWEDALDDRR